MMNETDKERLRLFVYKELKDNADLFDLEAEMDSSLTYDENETIIADKIKEFKENEISRNIEEEEEMLQRLNKVQEDNGTFWDSITPKVRVLVCYGDTGSGKTALMFRVLHSFKERKIYIYNHPKPKLIKALGYNNMKSIAELGRITDAVIWIDEPQLHFKKYDKKANEMFLLLCSLARQNDNTLIFSTSDTRWVNRGLESYVSDWIIKDIDMNLIKQGSTAKNIIKSVMPLAVNELNLEVNEYIYYGKKNTQYNGLHTFIKPKYFDERLSKAYKNSKNSERSAKEIAKEK